MADEKKEQEKEEAGKSESKKEEVTGNQNASSESPETELDLLRRKADEYLDGWKRAKADHINFRKDVEKRQQEIIQYANAALIAELLPIYSHFKLANEHIPVDQKEAEWVKGFGHIYKQLEDLFAKFGIVEIEALGKPFDPTLHEAIDHEEREGMMSDTVCEVVQPGYTLHGKVIMPARVKVVK